MGDVGGAVIINACPRCEWFSDCIADWPKWGGIVPEEACERGSAEENRKVPSLSAASVEIALRICYSARAMWQLEAGGEARTLCERLASWDTLTTADGVEHPVQLLLALAVLDELPDGALGQVPLLGLLNEVCARRARDELRQAAGTDSLAVLAAARKRCSSFLGVSKATAPTVCGLGEAEPPRMNVQEACCDGYVLDDSAEDFKAWVKNACCTFAQGLLFVQRLRATLESRQGGWVQLGKDMEAGPHAWADVVSVLQKPASTNKLLAKLLGVERHTDAERVLATIAAQAFLHHSSDLRRISTEGGSLSEPLGDVRDAATLRSMCVELRMALYDEAVAAKMRNWSQVGSSMTFMRAKAVDLDQYDKLCGSHVHGLDKATFWGLWRAAEGPKARAFLTRANQGFINKYGPK